MKKLTIMTLLILLLAACNTAEDVSPMDAEDENLGEDTEENEEAEETEVADEKATGDTEEDTSEQSDGESNEQPEVATDKEDTNTSVEKSEDEEHQALVDLTYDIFAAQNEADYDFLQSILAEGSTLDKENETFHFENVKYPHEQEFLTDENAGELEFRYTHENDDGSVIVGFAAIDYEQEYSFVIDFAYVQEDGTWKMNDMDINK